jgi:Carboxypeptidase regulatory-like domain
MPLVVVAVTAAACGGNGDDETGTPVAYEEVQAVFEEYGCTGCHPGVNASLDLRSESSYEQLVGVQALEDPTLYRVVAGDPERSFLYLKLGGAAPVADIPAIGTRMPPRAPPIDPEDLDLVRRWILQGAKDVDGQTGGPQVPTPGTPPGDLDADPATETEGSATIVGSVVDQRFQPIEGALVTMLLAGAGEEGGEEHYRVAVTDAEGRFTLADAPTGRYVLKAYGPNTIYVSRIVALEDGERQGVRFGLPDRIVENPTVASPQVDGTSLSLTVEGTDLDGNYTLAVNPEAGLVFELHNAGNAPGTWSTTIPRELEGPWIFMAVDETCNVSEFLTVGR